MSSPRSDRRGRPALVAAVLAALLAAACQPPPKPFQSLDPTRENPLAVPAVATGVLVRAVIGAPRPADFAEAMAAALTRRDIVATTGTAGAGAWLLTAGAETAAVPGAEGEIAVALTWDLADESGKARGRVARRARVAAADWAAGAPALLARLAEDAAPALAARFVDDNAPGITRQALTVHSVTGAPGDGNISLRRALDQALGRHGFRMNPDIAEDGIVITGTVRLTPRGAAGDDVQVVWTALAPDGATLGTVAQQNRVPEGSLARNWGIAAIQVADAAAPGIARLIARAGTGGARPGAQAR